MPDNLGRAEIFKRAIADTTRAMSREDTTEVSFSTTELRIEGNNISLPNPSRALGKDEVALIRGQSDFAALKLAHHNDSLHYKNRPIGPNAQAIFDMAEEARISAIGAKNMAGVAANIGATITDAAKKRGYTRMYSQEMIPVQDALSLLIREKLFGYETPKEFEHIKEMWRTDIELMAGDELEALSDNIENQEVFAKFTRELIRDLDLGDELGDEDDSEPPNNETPEQDGDTEQDNDEGEQEENETPETSEQEQISESTSEEMTGTRIDTEENGQDDEDETQTSDTPFAQDPASISGTANIYKAYTKEFDEIITAEELCDPEELDRLRMYLDQQLSKLQGAVAKLANRLGRKLLAQQNRSWMFDLEEGMLDAAKLSRVVTDPVAPLSFKQESEIEFRDTIVTILIDNSGSMRGRPIMIAATCADILARVLERCSVKTEILGFTTKAWKGGFAKEKWVKDGKPPNPGRLNELRHIIYKAADMPWRRAKRNLGLMMREGLLKENIDGEALDWAYERLRARPEQRRILMVISDGAPVDDSTLSTNSGPYLENHLKNIIADIEKSNQAELIAIGIGHDVTKYYKRAVTILDAEQLGGAMIDKLAELFDEKPKGKKKRR